MLSIAPPEILSIAKQSPTLQISWGHYGGKVAIFRLTHGNY